MGEQAFRLDENLMRIFIRKTMDLVLDGWAVARAYTFDYPRVHWGSVKPLANNSVCFKIRMGNPAG